MTGRRTAPRVAVAVALVSAALAGVHALTRESILEAQRAAERASLAVVLPAELHDNDPLAERITLDAPAWLGAAPLHAWRARRGGAPSVLVIETVAPDGYAGPIRLLAGVRVDGTITAVRVVAHRETPGLGDAVDTTKSDWIRAFEGRSLQAPSAPRWALRRDGGEFDQLAGATVTPRAIVIAMRRLLAYLERHGRELHAAPAGATLRHDDGPDA